MNRDAGLGASFLCVGGRAPTNDVLRELRTRVADFLVVRRVKRRASTFHTFSVDARLLQRLRRFRRRDLTGALDLTRAEPALPRVPATTVVLAAPASVDDVLGAAPRDTRSVILGLKPDGRGLQAVLAPRHDAQAVPPTTRLERGVIEALGSYDPRLHPWSASGVGVDPDTPAAQRTLWSQLRALGPALPAATLRVALELTTQGLAGAQPVTFTIPAGRARVDLHAIVSSRDFEPPAGESWSQRFVVDRRTGLTPSSWEFGARLRSDASQGSACSLLITFLCLGTVVAEQALRLVVGAAAEPEPRRPTSLRLPAEAGARFVVMLPPQGADLYRPRLYQDGDLVQALEPQEFKGLALFPMLKPGAADALDDAAEALRAQLSADLYAFMRGDEGSRNAPLLIVSSDTVLPFEALRVGRSAGHALFLGAERPVCRWVPDCRMSAYGRRALSAVVLLDGITEDLADARQEAQFLAERFPGLTRVASKHDAEGLMERTGVGLVHFIGHAAFDSARLTLADGSPLVPTFFDRDQPLLQARPVFFLNGCSVGRGAASRPVASGHFPRALVQAGAAAVIAPQVDVVSSIAQRAARAFYDAGPVSLAEAVQSVRRGAYDTQDDLERGTLLSYAAYTPADLSLDLPEPARAKMTGPRD